MQQLRSKMNIVDRFSFDYQKKLLKFSIASKRLCGNRRKRKNRHNTIFNVEENNEITQQEIHTTIPSDVSRANVSQNNSQELNQNEDQSPPNNLESSLDVTKLAEILADLTAGDIPPATNTISSELRTHGEASNSCHVDQTTNRLEGNFFSNNVFNLSKRNLFHSSFKQGLNICTNA